MSAAAAALRSSACETLLVDLCFFACPHGATKGAAKGLAGRAAVSPGATGAGLGSTFAPRGLAVTPRGSKGSQGIRLERRVSNRAGESQSHDLFFLIVQAKKNDGKIQPSTSTPRSSSSAPSALMPNRSYVKFLLISKRGALEDGDVLGRRWGRDLFCLHSTSEFLEEGEHSRVEHTTNTLSS